MDQATTQFDDGFDADAWRRVLAGLTMLLAAWIAIPVVMMSFLPCILIAIAGPVAAAIVVLGGVVYVAFGIGHCCRVPADSGARTPLVGAAVCLLNAVIFSVAYWMWFTAVGWPRAWLTLVVGCIVAMSLVLAQLAWLLFLQIIAAALEDAMLGRIVRIYAIAFSIWAGVNVAAIWANLALNDDTAEGAMIAVNIVLSIIHFFGVAAVTESARKRIEERLQAHEQAIQTETGNPA